jgi:enoyl-CoA hydratase/carnithine racemase
VYIDYEVSDRIATITLNRPEAANVQNRNCSTTRRAVRELGAPPACGGACLRTDTPGFSRMPRPLTPHERDVFDR